MMSIISIIYNYYTFDNSSTLPLLCLNVFRHASIQVDPDKPQLIAETLSWHVLMAARSLSREETKLRGHLKGFLEVDSSCWEDVTSLIPRAVFSLVQARLLPNTLVSTAFSGWLIMLEEVASFIPRAVFSLVPSRPIAKQTSFNSFLRADSSCSKRWLLSLQELCFN